ncbi:hypothetical protein [Rhizobium leguminosarum]|uniref:hypothetical protein n=1 Tax=Rhizobium leguminosarum TaxID=384 RepID=UPI001C98AB26|nr:hypothetical protein [Rhizobium leguminosarum]MBY5698406.1 hypothetical protein [Rhizobium leguminosarum]
MKFTKIMLATSALAAVAFAAIAQTYTNDGDKTTYSVSRGRLDNGTAVADRAFNDTRSDIYAGYKCGTAVSVSLLWRLADGTTVSASTVPCDTTQRFATNLGPQFAQSVAISPTTTVSTTAGGVSATIVETKK